MIRPTTTSCSTKRLVSLASFSSSRYTTATSASSFAKGIATARPIPLSPPVMIATLSRNFARPRCFSSSALAAASFCVRGQVVAPDVELAEVSFRWERVIYKTVDLARPLLPRLKPQRHVSDGAFASVRPSLPRPTVNWLIGEPQPALLAVTTPSSMPISAARVSVLVL